MLRQAISAVADGSKGCAAHTHRQPHCGCGSTACGGHVPDEARASAARQDVLRKMRRSSGGRSCRQLRRAPAERPSPHAFSTCLNRIWGRAGGMGHPRTASCRLVPWVGQPGPWSGSRQAHRSASRFWALPWRAWSSFTAPGRVQRCWKRWRSWLLGTIGSLHKGVGLQPGPPFHSPSLPPKPSPQASKTKACPLSQAPAYLTSTPTAVHHEALRIPAAGPGRRRCPAGRCCRCR